MAVKRRIRRRNFHSTFIPFHAIPFSSIAAGKNNFSVAWSTEGSEALFLLVEILKTTQCTTGFSKKQGSLHVVVLAYYDKNENHFTPKKYVVVLMYYGLYDSSIINQLFCC